MTVEETQKEIERLAKLADMPSEKVKENFEKNLQFYLGKGLPEKEAVRRALVRTQNALRKRIKMLSKNEKVPYLMLAKGKPMNMVKKLRERATEYVRVNGDEKALADGWVNAKGEFLYTDFSWRRGKPIPEEEWEAIGLAWIERKRKKQLALVRFKEDAALADIKPFTKGTMRVYVKEDINGYFDVNCTPEPEIESDDIVNFAEYESEISENSGGLYHENLAVLPEFHAALENNKNLKFKTISVLKADIIDIKPTEKGKIVIGIADDSLEDGETIAAFFDKDYPIDFEEGTPDVTLTGQTFLNKKGEVCFSVMSHWLDDLERVETGAEVPVSNIQQPWGYGREEE